MPERDVYKRQVLDDSASSTMQMLSGVMVIVSVFVAGVFCFLIVYANRFLMKRRKQEFALYMICLLYTSWWPVHCCWQAAAPVAEMVKRRLRPTAERSRRSLRWTAIR